MQQQTQVQRQRQGQAQQRQGQTHISQLEGQALETALATRQAQATRGVYAFTGGVGQAAMVQSGGDQAVSAQAMRDALEFQQAAAAAGHEAHVAATIGRQAERYASTSGIAALMRAARAARESIQ